MNKNTYRKIQNVPDQPDEPATAAFNVTENTTHEAEQTKPRNRYNKLKIILLLFIGFITVAAVVIVIIVSAQHNQLNKAQQNTSKEIIEASKDQTSRFQVTETKQTDQSIKNLITVLPQDCSGFSKYGIRTNGVYNITVNNRTTEVYCDMETDGGGWTVIQRRTSNDVDFYRNWQSYVDGFGNIPSNFWLGLETIHEITSSGSYQFRVDLEDFFGNRAYALYSFFSIENATSNFRVHVGGYSGTAGDSLGFIENHPQPFSTHDRDNDASPSNCAVKFHGAWWYHSCYNANLNGRYYNDGVDHKQGIVWFYWEYNFHSMTKSELKIKPI